MEMPNYKKKHDWWQILSMTSNDKVSGYPFKEDSCLALSLNVTEVYLSKNTTLRLCLHHRSWCPVLILAYIQFLLKCEKVWEYRILNHVWMRMTGKFRSLRLDDGRIGAYLIPIGFIFSYECGPKRIQKHPIQFAFSCLHVHSTYLICATGEQKI